MSLTAIEHETVVMLAEAWNNIVKMTGLTPASHNFPRVADLGEAAGHVHALQNMVLANCAARDYPDQYRLLGGLVSKDATHEPAE